MKSGCLVNSGVLYVHSFLVSVIVLVWLSRCLLNVAVLFVPELFICIEAPIVKSFILAGNILGRLSGFHLSHRQTGVAMGIVLGFWSIGLGHFKLCNV